MHSASVVQRLQAEIILYKHIRPFYLFQLLQDATFYLGGLQLPKSLEVLAYSTFNPFWQTLYPKAVVM